MATNPYSAAAEGIEAGFGMALRARADERAERAQREQASERTQERTDRLAREAKQEERIAGQEKRLAEADARQKRLDELKVLDTEIEDLGKEGSALFQQYGGYEKVPEDVRGGFVKRTGEARARRAAARRSFYEPDVQTTRREAAELASRLETGQLTMDQLTPDQLYKTIQVQARRPIADFVRTDPAKPSAIEQAALDLEAGVQTGNNDLVLRAANVLLAPELKVGVGTPGRDGSEIIEKRIARLAPHPQDPQQLVPILEVKVRRDDGSVGTYLAPVTEGRGVYGSDPAAVPKTISMQAAFDRVGQLSTMAAFVNRPEVRKALDSAGEGKASADEFLASLGMLGVAPPKKQITRERVDLGGQVLERDVGPSGEIIGERRLGKTAAPRAAGEGTTAEERNAAAAERRLGSAVKEGLITEEEARERRRTLALGGGGKGSMDSPKAAFDAENKLRDEHTKQSGTFVKVRDAMGKVQAAAKDPSAAGDIALIFSYMRILDPDSVVREGEFATAQNAASIPDRVRNLYNKALEGTRLNDKQRGDMVGQAKKVYASQKQGQEKLDQQYTKLAKTYGLNPENVVQKFETEEAAVQLPQAARAALKEGQITTFGNGQKWTLQGGEPVQVK